MKRLYAVGWILLVVLAISLVPRVVHAEEGIAVDEDILMEADSLVEESYFVEEDTLAAQANIAEGVWGTCPWTIDANGVLTVYPGVGANTYQVCPWESYEDSVTAIKTVASGSSRVKAPEDCRKLFLHLYNAKTMELSNMDMSAAKDMTNMFGSCTALSTLDISGWNVSSAVYMGAMFQNCPNLSELKIFKLKSSKVTVLSDMFRLCSSLQELELSGWDTSSVTEMKGMFFRCSKLSTLEIEGWKTPNLSNTSNMFSGCLALGSLDLSGWDTLQVNASKDMFSHVTSLSSVQLGRRYVIKNSYMFPDGRAQEGQWWSSLVGQWYTKDDIVSSRSGIADGYLSFMPNNFVDVNSKTAHIEDICWLAGAGISSGWKMSDGSFQFRPYANVARADMAAFLFRLAKLWGVVEEGWTPSTRLKSSFVDVSSKTSHHDDIWWLAEQGISAGWTTSAGKLFKPYDNVSRADMAAFVARLARYAGIDDIPGGGTAPSFRDVLPSTAHNADIRWLADAGISKGWAVGSSYEFRPYNNVARADMAAFLHRLNMLAL